MGTSAAQAAAFYRECVQERAVWTVRDERGFPAPLNSSGQRAQPFWSKRSRAESVVRQVPDYRGFEVVEVSLEAFLSRWLPGLGKDGLLVGLNWSGTSATGYDVDAVEVAENLKASDVHAVFPMARTIIWGDGPLPSWRSRRRGIVVSLVNNIRSRQEQPEIQLCAVPSDARAEIEEWLRSVVAPEAARWWASVSSTEVGRATGAHRYWEYDASSGST